MTNPYPDIDRTLPTSELASCHEECGVVGLLGVPEAAVSAYLGLYALQHRGQESAGIVASDGEGFTTHRGLGLVSDVMTAGALDRLPGSLAVGHNRYSTMGGNCIENAQPFVVNCRIGPVAVAHNGNLVNAAELRRAMEADGAVFSTTSDSEIIVQLIARARAQALPDMIAEAIAPLRGAYTLAIATPDTLIGLRDPHGFRPLVLGRLGTGTVLASESCALDAMGATVIREVEPGEMVIATRAGIESRRYAQAAPVRQCVFELIYFSRPDSVVFGEAVNDVRRRLGERLALESPAPADLVIAVPDSSNAAALAYAETLGVPFEHGIIRSHYVGRTFINPTPGIRNKAVALKYNPVRAVLAGKSVAVVDDSIVRGTTSRQLVKLLRRADAREVHFRLASPPVVGPCYYGIDTPTRNELIASSHTVEEIARYLNVDSLAYLSLEGLRAAVASPDSHCYACFTLNYPVPFDGQPRKDALEVGAVGR
jgi:amidophosphoribosyltransferase